jgi:hypothetical protein
VLSIDVLNCGYKPTPPGPGWDVRCRVVVFLDHSAPQIAERLNAAGVPRHRLRQIGTYRRHLPR